jgi:ubiquitin carboxyl-terminal hydrolase 22/27/51
MSVRKLPPVLCFHLKRFEHGHKQRARKLDVPIRFPVGE